MLGSKLTEEVLLLLPVKEMPLKYCGQPVHGNGKSLLARDIFSVVLFAELSHKFGWNTHCSFKKTETTLRDIAASFRVYADGLNLSSQLLNYD